MTKPDLHPDLNEQEKAELFAEGIDYFNAGRFFEAHEPWEEIWRSTNPEPRDLFQGLVQVAAGFHVWLTRDKPAPAARLIGRGVIRLRGLGAQEVGIDLASLLVAVEPWQAWLEERKGPAPPRFPTIRRR